MRLKKLKCTCITYSLCYAGVVGLNWVCCRNCGFIWKAQMFCWTISSDSKNVSFDNSTLLILYQKIINKEAGFKSAHTK